MAIEPVTREERFLAAAGGRSVTPPTPITRKEQLLQGIIDAVKSGGATPDVIENAVNNYLNANPVKPGATTEQAAQIERNKTDIANLQTEIDDKQPKGDYVKTVNGNKPDASGNVVVAAGGNGSGENVDLTGYAKETWVQEGFQPKGNYLTAVPDGYAKTEDIPTKPEDIGADPKGTAASAVSAHNTDTDAHNDLRLEVKAIREQLTSGKVNVSDIVNNLTTNVSNKPLSAAQGVAIKVLIDGLSSGKLDASKLQEAINTALAQAKASGEFDGEDGYTPVKGMDYYTADDKAEFEAYIATELAKRGQLKPEPAESLEWLEANGDTSKIYVLTDANNANNGYLYSHITVTETIKNYTNLATTFESGRFNSSGTIVEQAGATVCADYVPADKGDVVRIRGFGALTDYNTVQYTHTMAVVNVGKANSLTDAYAEYAYDSSTGTVTLIINHNNAYYLRCSGILSGTADDVVITVNEEIEETTTTTQKWANMGLAFVPADYEPRIIALEEGVRDLQNKIESMGSTGTGETAAIPAYWEDMVAAKTKAIKALQTEGGRDCVSFGYASDLHIDDNDNGRTTNIGRVMAAMLDNCEIPFAVSTGDNNTRASYDTEAGLLAAQAQMPIHLYPLWGDGRLLLGLGNHDGTWGGSDGYYRHQFPPERMWQTFFRWQALDSRRVFSDDGLYFYVDVPAQKMRFIVLNSHFGGEYAEDENGWAVNNRFATSCYGQAQLDWLADAALDMPEGYGAIITAHVPPNITYTVDKELFIGIVNAYNGKSAYSGSFTAGVDGWTNSTVNVDFTAAAKGEIIAMFAGHVHGDSIDTTTMSCPIITILSAGASPNEPYKDTAPTRTPGTDTETSFDVVTINRKTRRIYCTRVGAGADREVGY